AATVRHRQTDLGNLPQGRGARSEGRDEESHGGGANRNQEGLIARARRWRAAASQPAARCAVGSAGLGEWRKRLSTTKLNSARGSRVGRLRASGRACRNGSSSSQP